MKIKKTYIAYDVIDIPIEEDGKNLRGIVNQFLNGEVDDLNTLVYLVERNEDYDVFYGIHFNLDETNSEEIYRDIYISANVIDYTIDRNIFIEIEEEHIESLDRKFVDKLFEQLESRPCTSLFSIVDKNGFKHITRRWFSETRFGAEIKLLD